MRIRNGVIALLAAAPALAGCASDPAFWDAVAGGLDQAAYDLATQPVCTWYTDRYGVVRQSCVPAYAVNASYYVPSPRYRDRPDRAHRDDRRGRDHRGGGGDRDRRRDRGDHRGPRG